MDEESIPERRYAKLRRDAQQRLSEAEQARENNGAFDERYAQAVAATEEYVAFRAELPALLLEPRRARLQRVVAGAVTGQTLATLAVVVTVFATGRTAWWLLVLVPHLLFVLAGYLIKVSVEEQKRQVAGVVLLCAASAVLALVVLGVLSMFLLLAVFAGWCLYSAMALPDLGTADGKTGGQQ